ncbi:MAG: hypothetical protein WCO26_09670 [Deltaproteobacteria bacterium]
MTNRWRYDPKIYRWSTEITNRETKSLSGSADPQCRSEKFVTRTPLIAYWSYSLLVVWFVNQFRMGKDLFIQKTPWYFRKKNITFSDMLAAARRSHFTPIISRDHGKHQNSTKTIPARLARTRFSKKGKTIEQAKRPNLVKNSDDGCSVFFDSIVA